MGENVGEQKEYEIFPHEELDQLRDDIALLKKNPLAGVGNADNLKDSIDALNVSITKLLTLLTHTNDDLEEQFQQTSFTQEFSRISKQQEQVAQGILSIARMVQDLSHPSEQQPPSPQEQQPPSPQEQQPPSPQNQQSPGQQFSPPSPQSQTFSQDFSSLDNNSFLSQNQQDSFHPQDQQSPLPSSQELPLSDNPQFSSQSSSKLPPPPPKKSGGFFSFGKK